jgi:hypothetical protein
MPWVTSARWIAILGWDMAVCWSLPSQTKPQISDAFVIHELTTIRRSVSVSKYDMGNFVQSGCPIFLRQQHCRQKGEASHCWLGAIMTPWFHSKFRGVWPSRHVSASTCTLFATNPRASRAWPLPRIFISPQICSNLSILPALNFHFPSVCCVRTLGWISAFEILTPCMLFH